MLSDVTPAMGVLKDDALAAACAARDKDANAVVGEFQGGQRSRQPLLCGSRVLLGPRTVQPLALRLRR